MAQIELIIPTYNNPNLLHACLGSFKRSGVDLTDLCHITVINNGHPESLRGIPPEAYWYRIVQAPKNLGWEGGLTEGLRLTTSTLVGFVNDDIVVPPQNPTWLRRMVAWFRDPAIGAVGPSSNYVAGCQSIFWNPASSLTNVHTFAAPFLIGFFVVMRRAALDAIGGLDLTLPGGDDLDWSMSLRRAGYTLLADRTVFIFHHGQQTGRKEHGDFWNSEQMLHPIHTALIQKHGFAAYWNCVAGQPTPYLPPWTRPFGVSGSEEVLLRSVMPSEGPILDVGCGAQKVMADAIGVDQHGHGAPVPQLNAAASQAEIACDLNEPLPYGDTFAAGIIAKHILEHLTDPLATLRDWHRVLRPGGRLAVAVPDATKVNGIAMNPDHRHDFTPAFLTSLATIAGFSHIQIHDPNNGISFVLTAERNGVV